MTAFVIVAIRRLEFLDNQSRIKRNFEWEALRERERERDEGESSWPDIGSSFLFDLDLL